jgi:hypothetical protein
MGTLAHKIDERVEDVHFTRHALVVDLMDGRSISVPLNWYPRLLKATVKQRASWEICGGGYGIHWPEIDEDLHTEGLLRGARAPIQHVKKAIKRKTSRIKRRLTKANTRS